jgi:hypothetical protein
MMRGPSIYGKTHKICMGYSTRKLPVVTMALIHQPWQDIAGRIWSAHSIAGARGGYHKDGWAPALYTNCKPSSYGNEHMVAIAHMALAAVWLMPWLIMILADHDPG